jgi:chemosensory pili system protein ChpA (sensor histidine kinase/response regulator)
MKHDVSVEYDALAWVKPELDALLDRARQSLEAYVEEQDREDLISAAAQVLRQVRGTLQVVDLSGAVLLAEEMEALIDALLENRVSNRDAALGVLSTAVLQLPDYLEYVQSGHPDTPIVILPLLNDLRASRDAELLSENVVFVPDLAADEDLPVPVTVETASAESVAQSKRHGYQLSLLNVFRDQQQASALARMIDVFGALEASSRQVALRRLWWVASALVETLDEQQAVPVAIKLLLGRLDREMRRMIKEGEAACARELAPDLLKNLLFYVARAESKGPRAQAVRETFHLDTLLPGEGGLEAARRELSAPNIKLLETVSAAIREDLAEIRDQLEIYTHAEDTQAADFAAIAARLHKIADTLSMLGLGEARELVAQQAARIDGVAQGGGAVDQEMLMTLASAMLQTEQALQNLLQRRRGGEGSDAAVVSNEITAAGVREALRELNRVKDALLTYLAKPEEQGELAEAPKVLTGIIAALELIGITSPLPRLQAVDQRIRELLSDAATSSPEWIDALAEAITAVEMYLESRAEQRPEQQAFLPRADEALARLEPADVPVESESPAPLEFAGTLAEPRSVDELPEVSRSAEIDAFEMETLPATDIGSEAEDFDLPAITEVPPRVVDTPETSADDEALADPRQRLEAVREDADPEILDIFLEEAQEEIDRVAELLPQWRANHADEEARTSIRRSFHTLKGSGRLAGADLLGEFAWAFENMLNRVIDQTVELRNEHFDLLEDALPMLRQMVGQLNGGQAPDGDPVALMRRADAAAMPRTEDESGEIEIEVEAELMSAGETPDDDQMQTDALPDDMALAEIDLDEPDAQRVAGAAQPQDAPEEPAAHIDPGLLDIYTREARQHLAVIDDYLSATQGSGAPSLIDDSMVIALHTLNGSARTADLGSLSSVFAPLESLAVSLQKMGRPLPQGMLGIFQDAVATTEATLEVLPDAGTPLPDTGDLVARIEEALDGLDASDTLIASAVDAETAMAAAEQDASFDWREDTAPALAVVAADGPSAADTYVGELDSAGMALQSEPAPEEPQAESESVVLEPMELETPDHPEALDEELVAIFLDEGDELLAGSDAAVQAWESGSGEAYTSIETLQRELHTLKGGARMAGFSTIGDLTHALETLITRIAERGGAPGVEGFALLHEALDQLGDMLQQARAGESIYPQTRLIAGLAGHAVAAAQVDPEQAVVQQSASEQEATVQVQKQPDPDPVREMESVPAEAVQQSSPPIFEAASAKQDSPETVPETESVPVLEPDVVEETPVVGQGGAPGTPAAASPSGPVHGGEQVRVRAELLDSLVNHAGEVNIYHARLQQQISGFSFNLNELRQTVSRLRDQLRKLELETEAQILYRFQMEHGEEEETDARVEFDPLELDRYSNIQQLSRALAESLNDLVSIEDLLGEEVRDAETLLLQQQRVSTDLQDGLMRSRMVQFGGLAPRLRRIVRQTATELGKRAELQLVGEQSEVDRSVLDRLIAPLEHMLRNAVAHGLETPAEREAAGKPEAGRISVSVAREGSEVVVTVQDDGDGVDVEAVRAKAQRQGLIPEDAQLDDEQVVQLILESGFSTAGEVSQIAGRGVGMDVVVREVKQLGGALSIDSKPGRGTRFVVRLPFTFTITQALLAQAGEHLYALPLSGVEGVVRMSIEQLREIYAEETPSYEYLGTRYDVKALEALLGGTAFQLPDQGGVFYPLLLIRSGEHRVAVQVDNLIGSREIVVKAMGPQFAHLRGVAGATILGDGRVVLILDTSDLVRLASTQPLLTGAAQPAEAEEESRQPLIMVVDDSITIRKVTSRMLERNGFDVMTARDGMDAVAQLEERKPDLLLTDIEMPRMDGYELSSHVRNDSRFREIPIIVITSRSGEKHRQRARELGVDHYLGKPYQESDLLDSIRGLLRERRAQA